jgi:hypothetical protein
MTVAAFRHLPILQEGQVTTVFRMFLAAYLGNLVG